jgi:DNA-binding response OmpR family regulator
MNTFAPSNRPLHLLIVEDDEDSRDLLCVAMALKGHTVDSVVNGEGALERALAESHDAALVDIGLPGIDGYEVARRIREKLRDARPHLIALTGYARAEEKALARDAGFDDHIAKPVDLEEVFRVLAGVAGPISSRLSPVA